jgi:arylsulfatase
MVEHWWIEADRYSVLPLDDRDSERSLAFSQTLPRRYEFQPGMARFDRQLVPPINDCAWSLRAEFAPLTPQARGIILSCGSRIAGYLLYCQAGAVVFDYVVSETTTLGISGPLPSNGSHVDVLFARTGDRSGRFSLAVDGHTVASMDVPRTWTVYGISSGLTCGFGNVPVSDACLHPGVFEGELVRVIVEVAEPVKPAVQAFSAALHEE